jgi:hypothetical protein
MRSSHSHCESKARYVQTTRSASRASWGANPAREHCKNESERCSARRASKLCGPSSLSSFGVGSDGAGASPSAGTKKAPPPVDDSDNGVRGGGTILRARSLQRGACRSKWAKRTAANWTEETLVRSKGDFHSIKLSRIPKSCARSSPPRKYLASSKNRSATTIYG